MTEKMKLISFLCDAKNMRKLVLCKEKTGMQKSVVLRTALNQFFARPIRIGETTYDFRDKTIEEGDAVLVPEKELLLEAIEAKPTEQ